MMDQIQSDSIPLKDNNIEIRSEEVQEVLSKNPPFFIRWGNLFIFLVLSILTCLCWFIKYPDIVKASFKLTTLNTPKSLNTKVTGRLTKLAVHDKDSVNQGDILAYMESSANPKDILNLNIYLDQLFKYYQSNNQENIIKLSSTNFNNLGELQLIYQTFQSSYIQYLAFVDNGYYVKKIQFLINEISALKELEKNNLNQYNLQMQDFNLAEAEIKMQRQLAKDKVISPLDLRREESIYINKQLPIQQTKYKLIENLTAQTLKQKEILELKNDIREQSKFFVQALNALRNAVGEWESKYLLISPIKGVVQFATLLQENQYFVTGQEVFYLTQDSKNIIGEMLIPQLNIGKVAIGQKVLIKFSGYPYNEFGLVEGKVDFISDIPQGDSVFIARVTLPKGLITNYNKKLTYRNGMSATAEIITNDVRLIQRFIHKIKPIGNYY